MTVTYILDMPRHDLICEKHCVCVWPYSINELLIFLYSVEPVKRYLCLAYSVRLIYV